MSGWGRPLVLASVCAATLSASGCGYRFVGTGVEPSWGRLAVTEFANDSTEIGLGHACTASLRDRLGTGANPGGAGADDARLVVLGRVRQLSTSSSTVAADGVEERIEVVVGVRVVGSDGAVLYDGEVRGIDSARASSVSGIASRARALGARRACDDAMDDLLDELAQAGLESAGGNP